MPEKYLRIEGAIIIIAAVVLYSSTGYSWWWFVLLLMLPDITMIGYAKDTKTGAVIYNLGHSFIAPFALAATGYLFISYFLYVLSLIWLAHIGMDRMFGYGLKYSDNFKHTHLGKIGDKVKKKQ